MKTSSAKNKGRTLQKLVCEVLLKAFPHLEPDDVLSRSSGAPGEDIMLSPAARKSIPCSFECKNVEKINLWQSWEQTKANCGKYAPVLVIKRNRQTPLAVIDLDYLVEILATIDKSK